MAFITCTFDSNVLQKSVQFNAIIPDKAKKARVLYLLHGLSDDHTAWCRYTSIERYANEAGIAVIMPNGDHGFYTDMAYGGAYYTYFMEELYPYIQALFPVSQTREDTFVAGLSMGGYGALKFLLRNPDKFAAGASLSGCVDVPTRLSHDPRWKEVQRLVFGAGSNPAGTADDLFYLAETFGSKAPIRMYIACGTEDFLYQDNLRFTTALSHRSLPFFFDASPGIHDWNFWDLHIQKAIQFFLKKELF